MQRIIKTLPKTHPDFKRAKKELSEIFAKVENTSSYPTMKDLKTALENWLEKFSAIKTGKIE